MGTSAVLEKTAGRLLGPDGPLRLRSSMALTALVVYALFALLQHGEVMLGLIDRTESNRLTLAPTSGTIPAASQATASPRPWISSLPRDRKTIATSARPTDR